MKVTRYRTQTPSPFNFFFDDLFTKSHFNNAVAEKETFVRPATNVNEGEIEITIEMAVPGFSKEDIKVEVNDRTLTLSASAQNEVSDSGDGYQRREFTIQSFSRSFNLPEEINEDKISAKYNDGILKVVLPKDETTKLEKVRQIKIG